MTLNVLFTSVGRRVELMRVFRRAYATSGLEGKIVGVDIEALAPALFECDVPYIVPRLNDPSYVDKLCEICRRESIGLILPLIDPDIPNLARHRDLLAATGARLGVVDERAAAVCADKWLTRDLFASCGLQVPKSWLSEERPDAAFPLFIKPRSGSASQHTFRVDDAKQLAFFSGYVKNPIIQEYVAGPEITSDVVCDLDGRVLSVVSRQRIEVRGGEVLRGVTIRDDRIIDACVRIAAALPAVGPITVQCMMRGDTPFFTEINARLGGGFPFAVAAGADPAALLLARVAGMDVEIPSLGTYTAGLYLSRFDDSRFVTEAERDAMARRRI